MSLAVVMGGSITGLCAAAALARNFDRVVVLERDPDPGAATRRGVPQGHQLHVLLGAGQLIMNELFPDAFAALERAGALRLDAGTSFRFFNYGSWKLRRRLGVDAWFQSRPLLEHHIRQSLARNPKIELRFGVGVDQPIYADGRVSGLRLRDGSILDADLVVDATGRGSQSSVWLAAWGYGAVPEQRVRVGLGYVSGVFHSASDDSKDATILYQDAEHGNRRLGLCFPIEDGRKMIALVGYHGDHAPTEIGSFREWAKTLVRPEIADTLAQLQLVGELHKFTYPEQLRRCYGLMRRLPEGYLILGDAMCSFDPTFGQGMVVAAMQARQLAQRARPGRSTERLQRSLYRITELPFTMTACEAHRWPETTGWKPPLCAAQQAYMVKVFEAASHDPEVVRTLTRVMHFLAPPTAIMHPKILWRVLARRAPQRAIQRPASPFAGELSSTALSQTGC